MRHPRTAATGGLTLAAALLLAAPASAQDLLNCDDFDTQAEAQAVFDADDDGIACETLPGGPMEGMPAPAPGADPVEEPADDGDDTEADDDQDDDEVVMPVGGVATGAGGTAGPDNTGLIAAGGIAFTIGAGGLLLMHRRSTAHN